MARPLYTACLIATVLGAAPAAAQFINPFEALFGTPPRPPSGVPGGRPGPQQQGYPQYPDQRYPEQQYPNEAGVPRQGPPGVQTQPLPPPPGSSAAVTPGGPLAPGQRPRGTPQPADTSPQPGDEVIPEPPSQKIANKGALFSGLDKITGRIINFDVAIGETVQFGALQVTPRVCYSRPQEEEPKTDSFVEVDEITLDRKIRRIFTGWMFAESPGLNAVEHAVYDVWLKGCKQKSDVPPPDAAKSDTAPAATAKPEAPAAAAAPADAAPADAAPADAATAN